MDLSKCINKKMFDQIFLDYSKKIKVFLRSSKSKGTYFDKYRNTGYDETTQNPHFLNAMIKDLAPNSLILRSFGLAETGAKYAIIKSNDLPFIRIAQRIVINNIEYYVHHDAVGSKLQVFDLPFGYKRVIIFRKEKKKDGAS